MGWDGTGWNGMECGMGSRLKGAREGGGSRG